MESGFLAAAAKVLAIGVLTAGGAAGVYFVATSIDDDPADPSAQADEATATSVSVAIESPAAAAADTPTPIPGLTDTGYKTRDGRPLYAECVGDGVTLPPPTVAAGTPFAPHARSTPLASPPPGFAPPPFDWDSLPDRDTREWTQYVGRCFNVQVSVPDTFALRRAYVSGYGESEDAIFTQTSGVSELSIHTAYNPVDLVRSQAETVSHLQVYEIASGEIRSANGVVGHYRYSWDFMPVEGFESGATYRVVYPLAANLWVTITAVMPQPYDEAVAQDLISSIRTLTVGAR